jgi:hypothetical protein
MLPRIDGFISINYSSLNVEINSFRVESINGGLFFCSFDELKSLSKYLKIRAVGISFLKQPPKIFLNILYLLLNLVRKGQITKNVFLIQQ